MSFEKRIGTAVASLLVAAVPLAAQETCPSGEPAYGSIGVREYRCVGGSCSMNMRVLIHGEVQRRGDPYIHSFSTEPRLGRIDPNGPGAGVLREDDVLVAVDDRLITTAEGGRRLGSLKPGEDVKLTLRRNGRQIDAWMETGASCDLPLLDVRMDALGNGFQYRYVVGDSIVWAGPTRADGGTPVPADDSAWTVLGDASGVWSRALPAYSDSTWGYAIGTSRAWSPTGLQYHFDQGLSRRAGDARPSVDFGLELSCGDCGWRRTSRGLSFETVVFPVIESVEKGGPADQAGLLAGDILIGVSGTPVTSPQAGGVLGQLTVGESIIFEIRRADRFIELSIAPREATSRRQRM